MPEGCVSVAFAEQKWAEREAAFAQQLAQLRALVAEAQDMDAPDEADASVASDLGSMAELEDGKRWAQVAKGSRRALLRRQRDDLASKVRTKLKGVSTASSPFVERPGS